MSPDSGIFKHPATSRTRIRYEGDGTTRALGESDPTPPNPFLLRADQITGKTKMVDIPRITRDNKGAALTAVTVLRQQLEDILETDPDRYAKLYEYRRKLTQQLLKVS